ncbi:MAG: hypothetical protein ABJ000_14520 [Saccharospirillum sp.]|uniref:hypothetical protein n=1 Tax=Saccharospirillum sp. TaxID=2033801 RepID=UPI0032967DA8
MSESHLRSIGFKEAGTFSKPAVAKTQLNRAIDLFLQQDFICSLTLAGAADAVLAGILISQGEEPAHEASYYLLKTFRKVLDLDPVIDQKSKAAIFREWNSGRNRLKHHDEKDDLEFQMNDCDEAYWMIRRALRNAAKLGLEIVQKEIFDAWAEANVRL